MRSSRASSLKCGSSPRCCPWTCLAATNTPRFSCKPTPPCPVLPKAWRGPSTRCSTQRPDHRCDARKTQRLTGTVSMQEVHDAVARFLNQPKHAPKPTAGPSPLQGTSALLRSPPPREVAARFARFASLGRAKTRAPRWPHPPLRHCLTSTAIWLSSTCGSRWRWASAGRRVNL